MSISTFIVLFVLAMVLWVLFDRGWLSPKLFRNRSCQGKGWRDAFPSATKQEIREFLTVFVKAFLYSNKDRLKFSPNDKIIQVYCAIYPIKIMADAGELDALVAALESNYNFKHTAFGVNISRLANSFLTSAISRLRQIFNVRFGSKADSLK